MNVTSLINMSHLEARAFFLLPSSYTSINLPTYFSFSNVLEQAKSILNENTLEDISFKSQAKKYVRKLENVNYEITINKDGKLSWRTITLIHPILYTNLVYKITEERNWEVLVDRMTQFQQNSKILAVSMPVRNNEERETNLTGTILNWWKKFEQESIKLSLEYNYCVHTDISDCYGSIYTHTISWAIHGKEVARNKRRDFSFVGNIIDNEIQNMQEGQTNGIPQGSVLSDFIAEIILGYADQLIYEKISDLSIDNYKILRYRDDYRIFSNDKSDVEKILKNLSEILATLNFKLNTGKTFPSEDLITDSIKKDKIYWTPIRHSLYYKDNENNRNYDITIQKHLLIIHQLSKKFPNSGSIVTALKEFDTHRLMEYVSRNDEYQLVSIIIDIILDSPKVVDIGISIISKLISGMNDEDKRDIILKCKEKFSYLANTDMHVIWLQRLSLDIMFEEEYDNPLCIKVTEPTSDIKIWDSSWLNKNDIFDESVLIDKSILEDISPIIEDYELNYEEY